ncbi:MAG: AmmeMemoRadiSam system protein B [Phycisphaerae bacterium]|nr:AmmeMemoRadiSam system protein B [Phycisphaerae bacterium]
MEIRKPVVSGQFYPAGEAECIRQIEQFLRERTFIGTLPDTIDAAIVPHAGWMFSGSLAALALSAVKEQNEKVDTFIIFGAAHSSAGAAAGAVFDKGAWITPLGEIEIDEPLAAEIIDQTQAAADIRAHRYEHSIEVQIPFIQYLFEGSKIVPIVTPPDVAAVGLGAKIAEIVKSGRKKNVCLGSTDLTHYGPRYGFEPAGTGEKAFEWAKDVNDRQFVDLAIKMDAKELLRSALSNSSACGPGAAAATTAFAKAMGKKSGTLLSLTNSSEIMIEKFSQPSEDSVGYAAIVF